MLDRIRAIVEHPRTERFVLLLIVVNAVTLGLETSATIMAAYGPLLNRIDQFLLSIFVVELLARMMVKRHRFFADPWNVFDFLVVGIALVPATESFSVLRALRVLRVLRLITALPSLKRVVGGLIGALPGMGSIALLMGLIYYVFAVMGTKLFAATSPEQFGSLGQTAYTLFQVMTFDDWAGGIVKPLHAEHPYAGAFFIVFILLSAFMMLNLFIGVVVSALDEEKASDAPKLLHDPSDAAALRAELAEIRAALTRLESRGA